MNPLITILAACVVVSVTPSGLAQSTSHTAAPGQFKQLLADLQQSPGDQALREKIVKLALTLEPKPETPEDAKPYMARGQAALEGEKDSAGFKAAAQEFEKASRVAPWLAAPYYNLGVVQEKAEDYPAVIRNLRLYLLAAPEAADAEQVKSLIYKLEYKQEKIAEQKAEEERRAQAARDEQRRRDEAAAAERQHQEQIAAAQRAEAERIERAREEKRKL